MRLLTEFEQGTFPPCGTCASGARKPSIYIVETEENGISYFCRDHAAEALALHKTGEASVDAGGPLYVQTLSVPDGSLVAAGLKPLARKRAQLETLLTMSRAFDMRNAALDEGVKEFLRLGNGNTPADEQQAAVIDAVLKQSGNKGLIEYSNLLLNTTLRMSRRDGRSFVAHGGPAAGPAAGGSPSLLADPLRHALIKALYTACLKAPEFVIDKKVLALKESTEADIISDLINRQAVYQYAISTYSRLSMLRLRDEKMKLIAPNPVDPTKNNENSVTACGSVRLNDELFGGPDVFMKTNVISGGYKFVSIPEGQMKLLEKRFPTGSETEENTKERLEQYRAQASIACNVFKADGTFEVQQKRLVKILDYIEASVRSAQTKINAFYASVEGQALIPKVIDLCEKHLLLKALIDNITIYKGGDQAGTQKWIALVQSGKVARIDVEDLLLAGSGRKRGMEKILTDDVFAKFVEAAKKAHPKAYTAGEYKTLTEILNALDVLNAQTLACTFDGQEELARVIPIGKNTDRQNAIIQLVLIAQQVLDFSPTGAEKSLNAELEQSLNQLAQGLGPTKVLGIVSVGQGVLAEGRFPGFSNVLESYRIIQVLNYLNTLHTPYILNATITDYKRILNPYSDYGPVAPATTPAVTTNTSIKMRSFFAGDVEKKFSIIAAGTSNDYAWSTFRPFVNSLLQGRDLVTVAFGPSGSGKTYTMVGEKARDAQGLLKNEYNDKNLGFISRTCQEAVLLLSEKMLSGSEAERKQYSNWRMDAVVIESACKVCEVPTSGAAAAGGGAASKPTSTKTFVLRGNKNTHAAAQAAGDVDNKSLYYRTEVDVEAFEPEQRFLYLPKDFAVRDHAPGNNMFIPITSAKEVLELRGTRDAIEAKIKEQYTEVLDALKTRTWQKTPANPESSRSHAMVIYRIHFGEKIEATQRDQCFMFMGDLAGYEARPASGPRPNDDSCGQKHVSQYITESLNQLEQYTQYVVNQQAALRDVDTKSITLKNAELFASIQKNTSEEPLKSFSYKYIERFHNGKQKIEFKDGLTINAVCEKELENQITCRTVKIKPRAAFVEDGTMQMLCAGLIHPDTIKVSLLCLPFWNQPSYSDEQIEGALRLGGLFETLAEQQKSTIETSKDEYIKYLQSKKAELPGAKLASVKDEASINAEFRQVTGQDASRRVETIIKARNEQTQMLREVEEKKRSAAFQRMQALEKMTNLEKLRQARQALEDVLAVNL